MEKKVDSENPFLMTTSCKKVLVNQPVMLIFDLYIRTTTTVVFGQPFLKILKFRENPVKHCVHVNV